LAIKLNNNFWNPIRKSLRLQIILAFVICILVATLIGFALSPFFVSTDRHLDYTEGIVSIDERAIDLVRQFTQMNQDVNELVLELGDTDPIFKKKFLNRPPSSTEELLVPTEDHSTVYRLTKEDLIQYLLSTPKNLYIAVTDWDGNVLYKSKGVTETKIDVETVKANSKETLTERNHNETPTVTRIYPIKLGGAKNYIMVTGIPASKVFYTQETGVTPYIIAVITFIICFYWITQRKMKEIEEIAHGLMEMAKGNLKYRIKQKSLDELGSLSSNINYMASELNEMIEKQRQDEKLKEELITNVSHDLRTPLTSVMGYLRLVKDRQYQNQTQLDEYVDIAYGKSEQLKKLVDDLFDFTRLTYGGVQLKKEKVSLNQMLRQLIDELEPIAKENQAQFIKHLPSEHIMMEVDPDQMVRALENIFSNAIKYSTSPGTIVVKMALSNDSVHISVSNPCESLAEYEVERLFERFYRVDKARSSNMSGAGLGLAITKGIVELHGGTIQINYKDKTITLIVVLPI
jgi:signal transduction histidine kinase